MKKTILTLTLIVLILALSACGGAASEPEAANPSSNSDYAVSNANGNGVTGDGEFGMPVGTKLMLGTVLLEDTDYAVNASQATALLPLWKALRSFGESETTAQAEIDAVITQIGDTMTPEQVTAIDAMDLTMENMGAVAETLGIDMGGIGDRFGDITPEMRATMQAMRESGNFQPPGGDFPGGGPGGGQGPGGGFGGFGGAEMDPDARATAMAERNGARGARSGINSFLLDGIIEFLEAKIQ
jgi:hypothetical protein